MQSTVTQSPSLPPLSENHLIPEFEMIIQSAIQNKLLDGLVLGMIDKGSTQVHLFGSGLTSDSCFEIGSITKLFTIELLDRLVRRGTFEWSDPISFYLSQAQVDDPLVRSKGSSPISLLDLASHMSGLPLLPPNLRILDGSHPFTHYSSNDLEAYLRTAALQKPTQPRFRYSNLGFALLGHAMENATSQRYDDLLDDELLKPLKLYRTMLSRPGRPIPGLVQGHTQAGRATSAWTQKAFAPAGALCSTADDQLLFLRALLANPERRAFGFEDGSLDKQRTLGWALHSLGHYCRDGVTGGFCSYVSIDLEKQTGLVLLTNRKCHLLMQALANNCERALRGLPLIPLAGDYGRLFANSLDFIRREKRLSYALGVIRSQKPGAYLLETLRRCIE